MVRRGISLIELAVCVGIIGILLALLIPAVLAVRESGRRLDCRNRMKQIALAVASYELRFQTFPADGNPVACSSWLCRILPDLELTGLARRANLNIPAVSPVNPYYQEEARWPVPAFRCPSESAPERDGGASGLWPTSYAGNAGTGYLAGHGIDGVIRPMLAPFAADSEGYGPVRHAEIRDGLSNTALVSEWALRGAPPYSRTRGVWELPTTYANYDDFATDCRSLPDDPATAGYSVASLGDTWTWSGLTMTTYNHVLNPGDPSCTHQGGTQAGAATAGSRHRGGVNVGFADGHVRFVSTAVDRNVWRGFGSRAGDD